MRSVTLFLAMLVASGGCLDGGGGDADEDREGAPPDAAPSPGADGAPPGMHGVPAPRLLAGTSFTFDADGVYDHTPRYTVVVVNRTDGSQLLAAGTMEELVGVVIWNNGFFGPVDDELNPASRSGFRFFDFPLHDGKTWKNGERDVVVSARDVRTPAGDAPGFLMTMTTQRGAVRWEYAPSIGFITSFVAETDRAWERYVLREVGRASTWVWFEAGERAERAGDGPLAAEPFDVPDGFDAVAVSAGGTHGARVAVAPPPAASSRPWTYENPSDGEEWVGALLPATPGTWSYATADPQDGFAWVVAVPVRWITAP